MADFDWLTEDEAEWSSEVVEEKRPKKRPSWQFPLIMLAVLVLTVGGLYSILNRRADAAEEAVKADVRRTHELVLEAAEAGDVELFTTFLSGANARWLNAQREAVRRGRFDEASWLNYYLGDERPYRLDEITLSPNLDEAVVIYTRWYENREQVSGAVPLQKTAIYRRGEDRWLLAPPRDEFWGDIESFRDGEITISYPKRDERHVLRLSDNILASIPGICNSLPSHDCPDGWQLRINLSYDPETIINPTTIDGPISALNLTLPAPTLLGVPLDGAGYNLLYENYRQVLQRRLVTSLNRYLADRPELVPPVLESGTIGGELVRTEAVLPGAEMTFACATEVAGRSQWNVFHYSLSTGAWNVVAQRTYPDQDSGFLIVLPGGGYIIQDYLRDELLTARLLLWQEGQTFLIGEQTVNFDNALAAPYFPRELDPTGRYLVIGTSADLEDDWYILDRQRCEEATGCEMQPVLNVPIWSPDGGQALLEQPLLNSPTYRLLYRADESGQNLVEIGEGRAPFWLDETTYGYSRLNEGGQAELVVASSVDDEAQVWVEAADLIPLAPADRNWQELNIWNVWANPADPEMVILMTTPTGVQNSGPFDFFLVQGDAESGEEPQLEWLFSDEFPDLTGIEAFSPDGRFLLASRRGSAIYFRDFETGNLVQFESSLGYYMGWTPDGRYYIQRSDEALTLTSPSTDHQVQVLYDFSTCSNVQWFEAETN